MYQSVEISLTETDFRENNVAELNFNALVQKLDQVFTAIIAIGSCISKDFNFISSQINGQIADTVTAELDTRNTESTPTAT